MRRPVNSADAMSALLIATPPPPLFVTDAGVWDAGTHEGLRVALAEVAVGGWDCPAGRAVLMALRGRSASWLATSSRSCRTGGGSADPGEVLSVAWFTLNRFAATVAAADAPWAYLWTSVRNALAVDAAAAAMLSDRAVRRPREDWPIGVERLGDPAASPEGLARILESRPGDAARPDDGVSPTVATLAAHLSHGDDAEAAFWADAVDRALDVMADARRSYEEIHLRRDPYLRHVLGLDGAELAALAALLIGPRRGNREAQSFLLALHHDLDAQPDDVVGAVDRIRFLTSRRHAADAAQRVPMAA